jgi:conjugal transfer pilin signal peptidase TrbI
MVSKATRGYANKTALALFYCIVALLVIAAVFNCRLMFEAQKAACLPFTVAIVRYHHVDEFKRGDIVAFTPPDLQMGDMFKDKIIVKMIGAIPGDSVVVKNEELSINGKVFGPLDIAAKAAKYMHRDASSFERTEVVPPGKLLVVGTLPKTFDSRYWGFLAQDAVLGSVYPIY